MCKKINLMVFKKGQVWMLKGENWTPEDRDMGITVGDRPVIVYSNVTTTSDFVTVIPCSSTIEFKNGVILNLEEDKKGIALVHEIRPVPAHKLNHFLGCIDDYMLDTIDEAVAVYLGLKRDITIEQRFFAFGKNRRKNFHDGYPTPIVHHSDDTIIGEDNTNVKSTDDDNKLIITKKDDSNKKVKTDSKTKSSKKKRQKAIDIASLSDEDKKFICNGDIKHVASKYNICVGTAYSYRSKIKNIIIGQSNDDKQEPKKSEVPKMISTNKYKNKTYRPFANKKIEQFTKNDKRLFSNMDSCKLSTTMNIPVAEICKAQASFRKELGLK